MKSKYIMLREYCDHEGETWLFFMNEQDGLYVLLDKIISDINNFDEEQPFDLTMIQVDKETLLSVNEHLPGYLDAFNFVKEINLNKLETNYNKALDIKDKNDKYEALLDLLYKGNLHQYES